MRSSAPDPLQALAWSNIVLGVALGIYTGILLDTMVARPLWNSAILGPLFLFSGLSAGAAMVHLAAVVPRHAAGTGNARRRRTLQRHWSSRSDRGRPKSTRSIR